MSAFFAAPLLYAACNIFATPKVDSIYTIWDEHSREQNVESDGYVNESATRNLSVLIFCNAPHKRCLCVVSYCAVRSIVPEICDLDVATMNALIGSNESVDTVGT